MWFFVATFDDDMPIYHKSQPIGALEAMQCDTDYCPRRTFSQVSIASCEPEDLTLTLTLQKHVPSRENNSGITKYFALHPTQIQKSERS